MERPHSIRTGLSKPPYLGHVSPDDAFEVAEFFREEDMELEVHSEGGLATAFYSEMTPAGTIIRTACLIFRSPDGEIDLNEIEGFFEETLP